MGVQLPAFQTLVDAHWRDVARLAHALAGPVDQVAQLEGRGGGRLGP